MTTHRTTAKWVLWLGIGLILGLAAFKGTSLLMGNLGKLLVVQAFWPQFSPSHAQRSPIFAVGLVNSEIEALPAQWSFTSAIDGQAQGMLLQALSFLEWRAIDHESPSNSLWAARIHWLSGNTQDALNLASRVAGLGLNAGHQELGFVYDSLGDAVGALKEYATAPSDIADNFRLANYLLLAESCDVPNCSERYLDEAANLDPANPVVVRDSIRKGKGTNGQFLVDSEWFNDEPRLQRMAATVLEEALSAGEVSPTESQEVVEGWLSNEQSEAVSQFIELAGSRYDEDIVSLWRARVAAQSGNHQAAYAILEATTDGDCRGDICGQLARYSRSLSALTNGDTSRQWLLRSMQWYTESLAVNPNDAANLRELAVVATELHNLDTAEEVNLYLDGSLRAPELVEKACDTQQRGYSLGGDLLKNDVANPDAWSWTIRNDPPYGKAKYSLGTISDMAFSAWPALGIQGVAQKPLSADEQPSWAGVTTVSPLSLSPATYLLTFMYRTDRISADSKAVGLELTSSEKLWLPTTDGQWRYFGVVIPNEVGTLPVIRPAFRLYHALGSLYIQDVQVRRLSFDRRIGGCSRIESGLLQQDSDPGRLIEFP